VTFVVFDILMLYGVDLTGRPWSERRATLERLTFPEQTQLSPVYPDGGDLWTVTLDHGLEGVVAKRVTSTYQAGRRSTDWVKAAHRSTRTAAVVGWRPESTAAGSPRHADPSARLGAVLLGAPDDQGRWRYLGKAGSGLAGRRGTDLVRELRPRSRPTSPLSDPVPAADARAVTWCEPLVAVDVVYLQRTTSGRLRQPVVRALRTDADIDPWEAP
jgi:bifunctional non-homologous end joining protein LigD